MSDEGPDSIPPGVFRQIAVLLAMHALLARADLHSADAAERAVKIADLLCEAVAK